MKARTTAETWPTIARTLACFLLILAVGCGKDKPKDSDPVKTVAIDPESDAVNDHIPDRETFTDGTLYPAADFKDAPDPLASTYAVTGGELNMFLGQESQSLNGYTDSFSHTGLMFGFMYETLLSADSLTMDNTPNLARAWSVSEDGKTYTFWIDKRAKWSDGSPITAHDVVATYKAVMDSAKATTSKVMLRRLDPPVALDDHTVKFTAQTVHWNNLQVAGGFEILPKKMLDATPIDEMFWEYSITAGPYRVKNREGGKYVLFERNPAWWQRKLKRNQHILNFDTLRFKFYEERTNALEAFKDGEIDLYSVYMSKIWNEDTVGERFDKNWIAKQIVFNYDAVGFQGFAMNMRLEKFKDLRVRQALWHLLDREKMVRVLAYNAYPLHRSFYEDLYASEADKPAYVGFDVDKARALLKEAGWVVNPESGNLEKNGQPFIITIMTRDASVNRYMAIFAEDLLKVGIQLKVDQKDLAAWGKSMDEYDFEMTWASWGAGVRKDPEIMWLSTGADEKSGYNITNFRNDRVDEIIEQQKTMFDIEERHALVREVDGILISQVPYLLLWYAPYTRLMYWNKFGTPPWVLSKYGNEYSAIYYWWMDPDAAADLKSAKAQGQPLPKKPFEVKFSETFKP